MEEQKVKRRRTSTKHSQTGCTTCKSRHIKCDETQPRCNNCEKSKRQCVYETRSPKQTPAPAILEASTSAALPVAYYDQQPFPFRPSPTQLHHHSPLSNHLQIPTTSSHGFGCQQQHPFTFGFDLFPATSHVFENTDPFGSQRSTPSTHITTASAAAAAAVAVPSPQIRHPNTAGATTTGHTTPTTTSIVRNAVLANNVQSYTHLRNAVSSFSRDFRLHSQSLNLDKLLVPLIYRSVSMQHAVYANVVLQSDLQQEARSATSPTTNPSIMHMRHYNTAITLLQNTIDDASHLEENVGTSLALAWYDICAGDIEQWMAHMSKVLQQIRLRGQTIESQPLSLAQKYLFALFVRTEVLGSNSVCQPSHTDRKVVEIIYSGVPITNKALLPHRIELELLFAEISVFQYECSQLPTRSTEWRNQQVNRLTRTYHDLVTRLQQWRVFDSDLVTVEEAVGEFAQGYILPPDMGTPLISNDQEFVLMWALHCAVIIHLHNVAARFHIIPQIPIDECRQVAVLCCRILSGATLLDSAEPSSNAMPLLNVSYALDFYSGQNWVAEQFEAIARRYMNRNASILAKRVRQSMLSTQENDPQPTASTILQNDLAHGANSTQQLGSGGRTSTSVASPSEHGHTASWYMAMNDTDDVYDTFLASEALEPSQRTATAKEGHNDSGSATPSGAGEEGQRHHGNKQESLLGASRDWDHRI